MAGPPDLKDLDENYACCEGLIANVPKLSLDFPKGIVDSFISGMDSFERLLWWLFAGSTGAETRFQVLTSIKEQPRNAQQLSQLLQLDYTTVRHHLRVLEQNRLIVTEGEKYGKLYFLSETMEGNWAKLQDIISRTRHSSRKKAGDPKTEARVEDSTQETK
jgi:DNA-binding transcriptional ArsR family regulator